MAAKADCKAFMLIYVYPNVSYLYNFSCMKKTNTRLEVLKTYKIYIGGQFPRTESGRYYAALGAKGKKIANICLSSRKDLREAIVAARAATGGWGQRAAYNRSQILYRMAEMMEGRKPQFSEVLQMQGYRPAAAIKEIDAAIDTLIHYAGWCDKYQALFSTVNPVASGHYNFSVCEPMGVVGILAPDSPLLGLVAVLAPCIAGGNTCVVLAHEQKPMCAITLAEVFENSDLPAGVVNILTGSPSELTGWLAEHRDVNAIVYAGQDSHVLSDLRQKAAGNLKRIIHWPLSPTESLERSPYQLLDLQEIKTTWHPIQQIAGTGASY